jgi:WD40 repeat protein
MKASFSSNLRPLLRTLYVLLVTSTALLAVPKQANAQIYVAVLGSGVVGEYDEVTGQVINANFITGLNSPNQLLISDETLYITNAGGSVGKYDAKTGAAISASFITGANFEPDGLAVSGDHLFVGNEIDGTVGEYNAKTGEVINVSFVKGLGMDGIGTSIGLGVGPPSVLGGPGLLGDSLFVVDSLKNKVFIYSAATGKLSYSFTGAGTPFGIAFFGQKLLLADYTVNTISEYQAWTGETINANFITGLNSPGQIAVLGDKLFVANQFSEEVSLYNAKTGAVINASLISGFPVPPTGVAVKAQKK